MDLALMIDQITLEVNTNLAIIGAALRPVKPATVLELL
ncbi:MAG: hypothetical protein [Olavius algarvensis Gamma 3 endosymbiont]|nr:MAG: hypothetical protein [Olavius algarvensis Gamma 3 endosymbiont]